MALFSRVCDLNFQLEFTSKKIVCKPQTSRIMNGV